MKKWLISFFHGEDFDLILMILFVFGGLLLYFLFLIFSVVCDPIPTAVTLRCR